MNIQKHIQTLLSQNSENELLEFKEVKTTFSSKKLGQYFSALSNEANLKSKQQSWLLFGVGDNKEIIGSAFRNTEKSLQGLKQEIAEQTTGGISFIDIHTLIIEEKRVIAFQIPPAPQGIPIAFKGHYYARNNESLVALSIEKQERIRSQDIHNDWSDEICEGATIEDLSEEAIEKAKTLYARKHLDKEEEMSTWDTMTFLNKSKVTKNGKITNTAILLLGKPESEHFIAPAIAKISWILKDKDNIEKDYQHFTCPFLLSVTELFYKIRNLKYRYYSDGTLFPEEVEQYTPETIREAINNCIAHQDYRLSGKINVVENESGGLVFANSGSFIPKTIENVIHADAPSEYYRNRFLVDAMVSLNMIDTIGSGIKKMFVAQKKKFFPLPDYELENNRVQLTITGRVLDINYARKLAQLPDLNLDIIILLDKVQKKKTLSKEELKILKQKKLIEGRSPNIFVSSKIASITNEKAEYIKNKGIEDEYCQKIIMDYLKKFKIGKKQDFDEILLDKLSSVLDERQKKDKVKNILQKMKKARGIELNNHREWRLSKDR
ncbi:transcriptional regulator [Candidatus Peregrinibacteria bacterium]|nr:MAG: transcriptional regulator [Candidatus Peregrinibacteria bacterium]